MCDFFYTVKGHKVKVKRFHNDTKRYTVEFENGICQAVAEDLVILTDERIEDDKEWGKAKNEKA